MEIEYEATFKNVDKEDIRNRLKKAGAVLVKPEFMQKRINYNLPEGHEIKGGWLRVRDEKDKITMSLKVVDGDMIENQKEICIEIHDFEKGNAFLENIGCKRKAYQESFRELWKLDDVEITIDEWPFLEPYVEIEGKSETEVRQAAEKLSFDYKEAIFGAVDILYNKKYGISLQEINETSSITFNGKNPFIR